MIFEILSFLFLKKFLILGALNTLLIIPTFKVAARIKQEKDYIKIIKLKQPLKESFWLSLGCSLFVALGTFSMSIFNIFLFLIASLLFICSYNKISKLF